MADGQSGTEVGQVGLKVDRMRPVSDCLQRSPGCYRTMVRSCFITTRTNLQCAEDLLLQRRARVNNARLIREDGSVARVGLVLDGERVARAVGNELDLIIAGQAGNL